MWIPQLMAASVIYLTLRGGAGRVVLWVLTGWWWRGWRGSSRSCGRIWMSGRGVFTWARRRGRTRVRDCGLAAAVAVVAAAAGVSRATVTAGAGELADGAGPLPGRARRPGAGRPKAEDAQPGLRAALGGLLEAGTRGDPVAAVTWTMLSLRDLERELAALGFRCRKDAVARMLRADGYSLQGMSRVLEGRQHPDRDAQFRRVNAMIALFTAGRGPRDQRGREEEGADRPVRPGRAVLAARRGPGAGPRPRLPRRGARRRSSRTAIYDIAANPGFVSVGTSHDTAAFAVNALRLWWQPEGASATRGAAAAGHLRLRRLQQPA